MALVSLNIYAPQISTQIMQNGQLMVSKMKRMLVDFSFHFFSAFHELHTHTFCSRIILQIPYLASESGAKAFPLSPSILSASLQWWISDVTANYTLTLQSPSTLDARLSISPTGQLGTTQETFFIDFICYNDTDVYAILVTMTLSTATENSTFK
jgi:hypothetical protein